MPAAQIEDLHDGDSLVTSISTNLTVGAAMAPAMASPAPNMTVVTIRSAQSVADIVKYNMTACMVSAMSFCPRLCRHAMSFGRNCYDVCLSAHCIHMAQHLSTQATSTSCCFMLHPVLHSKPPVVCTQRTNVAPFWAC